MVAHGIIFLYSKKMINSFNFYYLWSWFSYKSLSYKRTCNEFSFAIQSQCHGKFLDSLLLFSQRFIIFVYATWAASYPLDVYWISFLKCIFPLSAHEEFIEKMFLVNDIWYFTAIYSVISSVCELVSYCKICWWV